MADPKTKDDETYKEGYDAGRNASGLDDFAQHLTKGMSLTEEGARSSEIYNKGYEEGRKDRD